MVELLLYYLLNMRRRGEREKERKKEKEKERKKEKEKEKEKDIYGFGLMKSAFLHGMLRRWPYHVCIFR